MDVIRGNIRFGEPLTLVISLSKEMDYCRLSLTAINPDKLYTYLVFDLFSWLAIGRAPDIRYVCLEIVSIEINDSDLHIWADIGNGIVYYHKIHERLCLLNKYRFSFFLENFRYVAYNTVHKNN